MLCYELIINFKFWIGFIHYVSVIVEYKFNVIYIFLIYN